MIPFLRNGHQTIFQTTNDDISQFFYLSLAIDVPWFSLSIDVVYFRNGVAFTIS